MLFLTALEFLLFDEKGLLMIDVENLLFSLLHTADCSSPFFLALCHPFHSPLRVEEWNNRQSESDGWILWCEKYFFLSSTLPLTTQRHRCFREFSDSMYPIFIIEGLKFNPVVSNANNWELILHEFRSSSPPLVIKSVKLEASSFAAMTRRAPLWKFALSFSARFNLPTQIEIHL